MSRKKPTAKQHAFLEYLVCQVQEAGVWPTYRQIISHFGYRSPNSVTQNLRALHKKGYLRRGGNGYEFTDKVDLGSDEPAGIPVRGVVSAGAFREDAEAEPAAITLRMLFPELDRVFAVRLTGQSIQGIDLHDGDYVLLVEDDVPKEGGICAVCYDGETSLKRVCHEDGGLRLEAPPGQHSDVQAGPEAREELHILGRYVGHVNTNGIFTRTDGSSSAA